MQLSDADKKLVARLKRRQQQLIRWRWIGLLAAISSLSTGIYAFVVLEHFLQQPDLPAIVAIACLFPAVYVLVGIGAGLMVYLFLCWNGRPETSLLLKLIDETQDDT
jgi:hypothetical protein